MTETEEQNKLSSSFSLREIPVSNNKNYKSNTENDEFVDKIKILELSNDIDKWEQELLFSENGFFSLKGKEVKNKDKEFINELKIFINEKIANISFSTESAKKAALLVKKIKIENIKKQLIAHQEKQMYEWEIQVYNNTIESCLKKAIAYKNNFSIFLSQLKKSLSVLKLIAQRQQWKDKILKSKITYVTSLFYFSLIEAFLKEKDIQFIKLYEKYNKYLTESERVIFEKAKKEMKNDIIAYNWAIEIFSYNLEDKETEKEIKDLKDDELEAAVRKFLNLLNKEKKNKERQEEKEKNKKNWDEIISLTQSNPAQALLFIDKSQNKNLQKSQQEYIKTILDQGFIETDKKTYIELIQDAFSDFKKFQEKPLYELKHLLSDKDFNFFETLQNEYEKKYSGFISDVKLIFEKFDEAEIKTVEDKYDLIQIFQSEIDEYEKANSKSADIERRNKLISLILERKSKKKEKGAK